MPKRRWTEKYRTLIQAFWFAFTNGYARGFTSGKIYTGNTKVLCVPGLNCYSCPGALYACPIGSLQAVVGSNAYRVSLYVSGLLALFGVFLGRLVCGFLCPFGLVQDLLYKIPFPMKKKNLPGHKGLKYGRYVVLVLLVLILPTFIADETGTGMPWFCEWLCPSGTLLAGVPLMITNPSFREAIGFQFYWKVSILVIVILTSIIYYRPFCKYLCPLGAIYGLFNPVSTFRLVVDENKCVKCGGCQRACGMDIPTYQTPNSPECIRCLKCVSACPQGAIDSTWNKTREKFESRYLVNEEKESNPQILKTTLLGGVSVLAGLGSICTIYKILIPNSLDYYLEEIFSGRAIGFVLTFNTIKCLISFVLIIAGIRLILERDDKNALIRFRERMGLIYIIWLIDIVIFIVGCVFDLTIVGTVIDSVIMNPLHLVGLLLLYLSARSTVNLAEGKGESILWWLLFIFTSFICLYTAIIGVVSIIA